MKPDITRFPAGKPAEIERMAADVKAIFLEVPKNLFIVRKCPGTTSRNTGLLCRRHHLRFVSLSGLRRTLPLQKRSPVDAFVHRLRGKPSHRTADDPRENHPAGVIPAKAGIHQ